MRLVRDQDLGLAMPLVPVVGRDDHHAREFAVRSRQRVGRERVHAHDLAERLLQFVHHGQCALRQHAPARKLRQERVERGKSRKRRDFLGYLRVVLHGAGAQGVEVRIDPVILPRQGGKVAHHIKLRKFGKRCIVGTAIPFRDRMMHWHIRRRKRNALAAGYRFFEDHGHIISSSASANRPISYLVRFSVTATRR